MPTELPSNRALWALAPNAEVVFDRSCLLPVAIWLVSLCVVAALTCASPMHLDAISQAFLFM
ncbi:MAG TPA: hypothetical protein VL492_03975 [Methylovirgula sp.]|jgi:hypothetical protein|nr:hypothetical protein [Methylovirgula sp.]